MKTTRRALRAECARLSDQLAATGHESRKVRAARLATLMAEVARLSAENTAQRQRIFELEDLVAVQKEAIDAAPAPAKGKAGK